jgi:hypothetical protein
MPNIFSLSSQRLNKLHILSLLALKLVWPMHRALKEEGAKGKRQSKSGFFFRAWCGM